EVSLKDVRGRVNLCIPYDVIEPIVPKLSAHYLFISNKRELTPAQSEALQQRLRQLTVPVRVLLGEAQVSFQELLDLQVGDYISLETKTTDPLPVIIGSKTKFLARPGRSGNKMAIQLVGVAEHEKEYWNE